MDLRQETGEAADPTAEEALSVSQLTERVKFVLEDTFPAVWVSGEISNFSRPQSGHCYFTLKDDRAQIRCVMWRGAASRLNFELGDGLEVLCFGAVDVYPPRGSYQLVVSQIHPKGMGELELALRRLKEKLAKEGLFDPALKQPLPRFPRRIGFVTSPTGAAIYDFLQVLHRRWQGADVLILPARVQGTGAAEEIAAGIATANRLQPPLDVLVVGRGGGSLEDLWAFNEERVVRAIHASRIPVISAVGHEIDVTLSDLVADVRALTPSEAAERVVPARQELEGLLQTSGRRLAVAMRGYLEAARAKLEALSQRTVFRRPLEGIHIRARQVDELGERLRRGMRSRMQSVTEQVRHAAEHLEALSPLAVLGRGYSVTEKVADGTVVRDAAELTPGDLIRTRLRRGQLTSRVESDKTEKSST